MVFGFSKEISSDVRKKGEIITAISLQAELFFQEKNYGSTIEEFVIGIICVSSEFDSFFTVRKKYNRAKKLLEYDIKLDHERFKTASNREIYMMVKEKTLESLDIIKELKVKDFDLEQFSKDLKLFFEMNEKLGDMESFKL